MSVDGPRGSLRRVAADTRPLRHPAFRRLCVVLVIGLAVAVPSLVRYRMGDAAGQNRVDDRREAR